MPADHVRGSNSLLHAPSCSVAVEYTPNAWHQSADLPSWTVDFDPISTAEQMPCAFAMYPCYCCTT